MFRTKFQKKFFNPVLICFIDRIFESVNIKIISGQQIDMCLICFYHYLWCSAVVFIFSQGLIISLEWVLRFIISNGKRFSEKQNWFLEFDILCFSLNTDRGSIPDTKSFFSDNAYSGTITDTFSLMHIFTHKTPVPNQTFR